MMRKIRMGGLWVHLWQWLVVSLCCACVATLIRFILPVWLPLSIASIWIFYFHSLFSVVGVYGLGLLLLTIQLKADKRMLAYPLVATWAIGSFIIIQQRLQTHFVGVYGLELLAILCLAVVGILLLSIAWTRFPNVEWGNGSEL